MRLSYPSCKPATRNPKPETKTPRNGRCEGFHVASFAYAMRPAMAEPISGASSTQIVSK